MKMKRKSLSDQVRQAVDESGLTRYRVCKECGLDQGAFSHFMAGKIGMKLSNLDAVADLLDLRIVAGGNPRNVEPNQKPGPKPKGSVKP